MANSRKTKRKYTRKIETRSETPVSEAILKAWANRYVADSGLNVTPEDAMSLSTFNRCSELIVKSIAMLDLHVFQNTGNGRQRIRTGVVYEFIRRPNTLYSFGELIAIGLRHVILYGNGYVVLQEITPGKLTGTILNPNNVEVKNVNGNAVYIYHNQNTKDKIEIPAAMMLHFKNYTIDGFKGISIVDHARSAMGFAMAAEKLGSLSMKNGSKPSGILTVPGLLSKNNSGLKEWTRQQLTQATAGDNAFNTMVLDGGAEFKAISVTNKDNQFMEIRQFSPLEICRFFGVSPHLCGIPGAAAGYNSLEQQTLEFKTFTLLPWLSNIQDEINYKLLNSQDDTYVEYNADRLLTMDAKTRAEVYKTYVDMGAMSRPEVRQRENMPEVEGLNLFTLPLNQVYLNGDTGEVVNFNESAPAPADPAVKTLSVGHEQRALPGPSEAALQTVTEAPATETTQTTADAATANTETRNAFCKLLRSAVDRLLNKEKLVLRKAWNKCRATNDVNEFRNQMNSFFSKHTDMVSDHLSAIVESYADLTGAPIDIDGVVNTHIAESKGRLITTLNETDNVFELIEKTLDTFGENRPDLIGGTND